MQRVARRQGGKRSKELVSSVSRSIGAAYRLIFAASRGAAAVAQTAVARFAIAGISVLTGVLTARVLGVTGRGEQSAMLVWPALMAYLLTLGLPSAMRYWIKREPERRSELFTVALVTTLGVSVIACAIGVVFIPIWLRTYSLEVVRGAQFLMLFAPEVMLGLILTAMLETLGDFNIANGSRYISSALTLLVLLVLAILHRMTPLYAAIAYSAPQVFVAGGLGWRLRSHLWIQSFNPIPALRALTSYGMRSYGIEVLGIVAAQIDQVFVIGFLGAADVGIYAVALSASRVITILHSAVVTVIVPSVAGLDKDVVLQTVGRSARISTLIALPLGAALAAALPILMPLLYGSAFARGIFVAQILTAEALVLGLLSVLAQAFMAFNRPGFVTSLQVIGLAVVVPLMLVLLPRFGLLGAALALLASTLCRLGLLLASFPLLLRVPVPNLFPTRDDLARLRAAAVGR
jgi:enterobacterial common antigen flippase